MSGECIYYFRFLCNLKYRLGEGVVQGFNLGFLKFSVGYRCVFRRFIEGVTDAFQVYVCLDEVGN